MKHSVYLLVIFILSGCNGSDKPVNIEYSAAVSKNVTNIKTSKVDQSLNFKTAIDSFITTFLTDYDTLPFYNNESGVGRKLNQSQYSYVKRQLFKKRTYIADEEGKKYYKRFELIAYAYKDSTSCNDAFES